MKVEYAYKCQYKQKEMYFGWKGIKFVVKLNNQIRFSTSNSCLKCQQAQLSIQ